MNETDVYVKS